MNVQRCLTCGRRWLPSGKDALRSSETSPEEQPLVAPCGHVQPPLAVAAEPKVDLPTSVNIPGYRILSVLGRGGFSTVFKAERTSRDRRTVAIKVLAASAPEASARLIREGDALVAVGPPYVPQFYEIGTLVGGQPYLVCEYVPYPSLALELVNWGRMKSGMSLDKFFVLADCILTALEVTHKHNFIHCDIKPENLLVRESPMEVRLIDFGISQIMDDNGASLANSPVGMALGTPDYMAPEQCQSGEKIDQRTDIYSAGVVLYEMLTGQTPFFGSAAEVREAHVVRRPQPPSRLQESAAPFDDLILRCLAKDPNRRWPNVIILRNALGRAARSSEHSRRVALASDVAAKSAEFAVSSQQAKASARTAARSKSKSQKPPVGLLLFNAAAATGTVQQALNIDDGHLANVIGSRCVAVFVAKGGDNPVERAYASAGMLLERGLTDKVIVDRRRVMVRTRPDGSVRVFSSGVSDMDNFPGDGEPAGVLFTRDAAEAVPSVRTVSVPRVNRDELFMPVEAGAEHVGGKGLAGDETMGASDVSTETIPLIGRSQIFRDLLDSSRQAMTAGVPMIVTVFSEAGYGKSSLAAALASELRRAAPVLRFVQLRAREPMNRSRDATLRALMQAILALPEEIPKDQGKQLLIEALGDHVGSLTWPAAALALGWLGVDSPEVRRLGAAPLALRSAVTRSAGEALRRIASERPLCLILDDVHFADDATLDALEYATLAEFELPIWVCVLARPSFESARPNWGRRAGRARRFHLGPLDRESAMELCRVLLQPAENVSLATLARIVEQTQGNPLFLVELVRGIKQNKLIRRQHRGKAWYLATDEIENLHALPRIEWLAERELAALPPELVGHARLLAQLGAEFSVAEIEGVMRALDLEGFGDAFPLDAEKGVHRLLDHGLLVEQPGGRCSFRHQLIREHIAHTTPEELRRQIHNACFRFFRSGDASDPEILPRLARHAAEGGDSEIAAAMYLELAGNAANRHDYLDAEQMYSRALELLSRDAYEARMKAYSGRGIVRSRLSRFEDAVKDLEYARTIALRLGDVVQEISLLLDLATTYDWTRDYRESSRLVDKAETRVATLEKPHPTVIEARMATAQARAAFRTRDWHRAEGLFERAIALSEPLGDQGYENLVISLSLLGVVTVAQGNIENGEAIFDRVISLCEARGDRMHLASALNNRREVWLSKKDVERAAIDGLRCRTIGREIGQSEIEYASSHNLAEIYYYAGNIEAAWPHMRRAVEIEPSNSLKPLSLLLQARLLAFAERLVAARTVLIGIRRNQVHARTNAIKDALFLDSEEVLLDMAELVSCSSTDEGHWRAVIERAQRVSQPEELAEVLEMKAIVTLRQGNRVAAMRLFEQALQICKRTPHLIENRIRAQWAQLTDAI